MLTQSLKPYTPPAKPTSSLPPLPRLHFVPASKSAAAATTTLQQQAQSRLPPPSFRRTNGLFNAGTDCFFNSVLQILANIPLVSQLVLQTPPSPGVKDALDVFREALEQMRQKRVTDARGLLRLVQKASCGTLRRNRQEDAHEALRVLLEALQRACLVRAGQAPDCVDAKFSEKTLIFELFGGSLVCETNCPACAHVSRRHESFLDLSLEIGRGCKSVADALSRFQAAETLDKDNLWQCDKCKARVRATRRLVVGRAPPVLVVHLKRFAFRPDGSRHKLRDSIDLAEGKLALASEHFELAAIVIHSGLSVHGGHYYALCRTQQQTWLRYDDEDVFPIRLGDVLAETQSYILVYEKRQPKMLPPVPPPALLPNGLTNGRATKPVEEEEEPVKKSLEDPTIEPLAEEEPPPARTTRFFSWGLLKMWSSKKQDTRLRAMRMFRRQSSPKQDAAPNGWAPPSLIGQTPIERPSFSFDLPTAATKEWKPRYNAEYDLWDATLDRGRSKKLKV